MIRLSGSLFTRRIITDDVECYDRSNRLREVVFAVLVNKIFVLIRTIRGQS